MIRWSDFGRSATTLGTAVIVNQLMQVAAVPIIGRLYGPTIYGQAALIQAAGALLATVSGLRYELGIVIAADASDAVLVGAVQMACGAITGVIAIACISMFSHPLAMAVASPALSRWLVFTPVIAFATSTSYLAMNGLIRGQLFAQLAAFQLAQSSLTAGLQVAAAFSGRTGLDGLLVPAIVGPVLPLAWLAVAKGSSWWGNVISTLRPAQLWRVAKEHARFPLYVMPTSVLESVRERGVVLLLAAFTTPTVVGYYSLARRLVWAPQGLISGSLNSVIYQRATQETHVRALAPLVYRILRGVVALVVPPFVFLAWRSNDLFAYGLGDQWRGAGIYATLMVLPAVTFVLQGWLDRLPSVVHGQRDSFLIETGHALLTLTALRIALGLGLGPIAGVAIVGLFAVISNVSLLATYYRQCRFPYSDLAGIGAWMVAVVVASTLILSRISRFWPGPLGLWIGALATVGFSASLLGYQARSVWLRPTAEALP